MSDREAMIDEAVRRFCKKNRTWPQNIMENLKLGSSPYWRRVKMGVRAKFKELAV